MRSRIPVLITGCLLLMASCCEAQVPVSRVPVNLKDTSAGTIGRDTAALHWLRGLYEPGVQMNGDSIVMNDEAKRLFSDSVYRKIIYPPTYDWDMVKYFIKNQYLQQAFWFLINLYSVNDKNKELVIKTLLTYDKVFNADKILVSAFHTYCFTDPDIAVIHEGQLKVVAPQVMEKKLNALKEMLFYLHKYQPEGGNKENTSKN